MAASGCLIVWGVVLVVMALLSKRLVVSGTLDQWMSFGSDVGKHGMDGASSGRDSAVSDGLWRLDTLCDGNARIAIL
jgi:hypothetical protein